MLRVLEPVPGHALRRFDDILLHDGSSFALVDDLTDTVPRRLPMVSPAAVEVHATMSLLHDQATWVHLTPDTDGERQCLPAAVPRADGQPALRYHQFAPHGALHLRASLLCPGRHRESGQGTPRRTPDRLNDLPSFLSESTALAPHRHYVLMQELRLRAMRTACAHAKVT